MLTSRTQKITDDLFLIPLDLPTAGYNEFISVWLYLGQITCLIDVGPSTTAPILLRALDELKINRLDYILLTHIHLDHAGAIGEIADVFPQTPIICHQAARSHLIEPSRLWAGTKKVLGSMALSYGPIKPVAGNRLIDANDFKVKSVVPLITPGHAVHHVSYQTDKYLFAGEAAGVYVALPQNTFYLRPATPPRFFLNIALQSMDSLIACHPHTICYAHFGINKDAATMLQNHRNQLLLWEKLIEDEIKNGHPKDPIDSCIQRLLEEDPLMAAFNQLTPGVKERETYFLRNSIKGYLGYLGSER
jgi:glyoxylase-like metal-dependent hydrolase (beta-lactamase superfamily II)